MINIAKNTRLFSAYAKGDYVDPPQAMSEIVLPALSIATDVTMVVSKLWTYRLDQIPPHTKRRNRYQFSAKDLISGCEYFWHAPCDRGAVVLQLPFDREVLERIIGYAWKMGHYSTLYQLFKGSPSGIQGVIEPIIAEGHIALHFSASNGLDGFDFFAKEETINDIDAIVAAVGQEWVW